MKLKIYLLLAALAAVFTANAQDTASFKPSGNVYGQVFGDFQYKAHTPDSLNQNQGKTQYAGSTGSYKDGNGNTISIPVYPTKYSSFEFRRIYLGYKYNFTERLTADVLLSHENNATLELSGQRTVFIKAANLRWKGIFSGTDIIFGQQQTPTFATFTEVVYDHRWVEKTMADMRGLASSNDFGVALQGKYNDGKYGYTVMVGNDNGGKPENDNFKRFYGEVWGKFVNKHLIVNLYADDKLVQLSGNPSLPAKPGSTIQTFTKSQMMVKGFVAWQVPAFTVGLEVLSVNQKNFSYTMDTAASASKITDSTGAVIKANVGDTTLRNAMLFGLSAFVSVNLIKEKLGLFARYDAWDPDNSFKTSYKYLSGSVNNSSKGVYGDSHVKETFIVFGLDWTPSKNFHIMPNVWYNGYKETALVSDPTVSNATQRSNTRQETGYDMDYRVTVFWKF